MLRLHLSFREAEVTAEEAPARLPQLSGVDALTTTERRVAAMAADDAVTGRSRALLLVSHKTVEKQLTAADRKLGVGAREGRLGALAKE